MDSPLPQVLNTPRSDSDRSRRRRNRLFGVGAVLAVVGTVAAVVALSTAKEPKLSEQVQTTSFATSGEASRGGFLDIHVPVDPSQYNSSLLFTIPPSSLNTPFVIHSTFDKGSAPDGVVGDNEERSNPAEDQEWTVFHFELSESGRSVHLVRENYITRTNDGEIEYALKEGLWTGYVDTVPVLEGCHTNGYMIPADSLAAHGFYVSEYLTGSIQIMREHTRAFRENANVLVQYHGQKTYSIFFSILRLPATPMAARAADDRVGFFAIRYKELGMNEKVSKRQTDNIDRTVTVIKRRRLDKDANGNTINPITYYIDPSVPKRWRQYFKQGVEIWRDAFAQAGYKNAIRAVLPDDADFPSDYHVGDMRYNSISVMISPSVYALGPSVVDPRSGEILHSDITFAHGWVKSWVGGIERESPFVPKTSSALRKNDFQCHRAGSQQAQIEAALFSAYKDYSLGEVSDETIGAAFRETVMHEVGHTIGLRHNFIASMDRTMEQLMDPEYTKKYGTTASVMDYVPTNFFSTMTQDEAQRNIFFTTVLGEYDYAAIKYGYSDVAGEIPTYKNAALDELARTTPRFATDEDRMTTQNPYAYTFDLSSDPIGYYLDRVNLIKKLREQMMDRFVLDGESWTKLWSTERFFLRYTNYIMQNLARFIAGVSVSQDHRYDGISAPNVTYVSAAEQMRVLNLAVDIVTKADGIFPPQSAYSMYVEKSGNCDPGMSSYCYATKLADVDSVVQEVRMNAIQHVLSPPILLKLIMEEGHAHLTIRELFMIVSTAVFKNPTEVNNFNLQKAFFRYLAQLSQVSEQRIASEAVLALMMVQQQVKQLMADPTQLPPAAMAHFVTLAPSKQEPSPSSAKSVDLMTLPSL